MSAPFWLNDKNKHLFGICHIPHNIKSNVAAILIAGLVQPMCDIDYFMSRLARRLCEQGVFVFQIDFFGMGDSSGFLVNVTYQTLLEDIHNSIKYVQDQGFKNIFCVSRGIMASLLAESVKNYEEKLYVVGINPYVSKQRLDFTLLKDDKCELSELYEFFIPSQIDQLLDNMAIKKSNLTGQKISCSLINDLMKVELKSGQNNYWIVTNDNHSQPSFIRDANWQNKVILDIIRYIKKEGDLNANSN